jgi:hypothetical protein
MLSVVFFKVTGTLGSNLRKHLPDSQLCMVIVYVSFLSSKNAVPWKEKLAHSQPDHTSDFPKGAVTRLGAMEHFPLNHMDY